MSENHIMLLFVELLLSFALPITLIEFARSKGPEAIQTNSSRSVLVAAYAALFVSFKGPTLIVLSGIGAVVLTTMVAISYRKMVVAQVSKQLELAPAVVKFALANFDRMVSENSEVLTSAILWAMLDEGRVAKADREIVEHMAVRISDIGHVIDVAYASAGYHSPGAVYNVYGISRQDLVTYEARLKRNYSGWIG